jgi:hypothetical protein
VTEEEYYQRIRSLWPRKEEASLALIALADEAVARFPRSPRLWCLRGNLITLGPEENPHSLADALASYRCAAEVDPTFAEAWEEIGHHYDVVLADEAGARPFFERAAALKQTPGQPPQPASTRRSG